MLKRGGTSIALIPVIATLRSMCIGRRITSALAHQQPEHDTIVGESADKLTEHHIFSVPPVEAQHFSEQGHLNTNMA